MPNALRRFSALSVVFAGLLASAPAALAQGVTIPEVVVTPNLLPTDIDRVGSAVSVITAEDIQQIAPGSVADLFERVPGVTIVQFGGIGGSTEVNIRGTESQHTLVLIDGVRVNDPASARNDFDFALFSPTAIERIEVLRGPQSALYGSDAIGGVINVITRKPEGEPQFSVSTEGGSYGTWTTTMTGDFAAGPLSLLGSGTYFRADGFSHVGDRDDGEADATEKYAGTLRGAIDSGEGPRIDFGFDDYHQFSEIDGSSTLDASGYSATRDLLSGFAKISAPAFAGRLNNSLTFFDAETTRLFKDPAGTTRYRGSNLGAEYQGVLGLDQAGTFLFGARVDEESGFSKNSDDVLPSFDDTRSLYAGYGLYQLPINQLNLSFAGRYDGAADDEGFLTGRMTGRYDLPGWDADIRGSVGTGAKRPTLFELSWNPDLVPEKSVGADIGFDKQLFNDLVTLSVTGFYNHITEMIDFDFTAPPFGNYENIAEVRTQGVEVSATATLVPGMLTSTATYTYLDARDLVTGLVLRRRAANSGTVGLTYIGIPKLSASVLATLVGERFSDAAATVRLDPYARVDLYANYAVDDHLSFYGRVENLFDADYQEAAGYNTPGVSGYVGLRWIN